MKAFEWPVFVFGGTHGNEWTGVYAVTRYEDFFKKKYPALNLKFIFANPEAHKINKRFKDEDLNRAFQFLSESRPHSFEHNRAKEIKQRIDAGPCFVIDLHTTTANMGKTLILSDYDPLNLFISSQIATQFADARIIGAPDPYKKYLASQTKQSLMIEVGPIANGVIDGKVLEETVALLDAILNRLNNLPSELKGSVDVFEEAQDVHYPLDDKKEIRAYIHSAFQGKDFIAMKGKITPFKSFSGEEISMEIQDEMHPIFINEAAYYPQQLAFTLCRKTKKQF